MLKNNSTTTVVNPDKRISFSEKLCELEFLKPSGNLQMQREYFTCKHSETYPCRTYSNCQQCGVYLSENGIKGFKSKNMDYKAFSCSQEMQENMFNKKLEKFTLKLSNYVQHRNNLVDWIFEIAEKLQLTSNTVHLGIYYMDYALFADANLVNQLQITSATCLFLAAKAVEKDERIPFIPKLRKLAAPVYTVEDFKKSEMHILGLLNWNLQFCTNLDVIEHYLSQGIVYSGDEIEGLIVDRLSLKRNSESPTKEIRCARLKEVLEEMEENQCLNEDLTMKTLDRLSEERLHEVILKLEADSLKLAKLVVKDHEYLEFDEKLLGATCIAFVRSANHVSPIWNEALEQVSNGVSYLEISPILDIFYKKFLKEFKSSIKEHSHISFQSPLSKNSDAVTSRSANNLKAFSDSKNFEIDNKTLPKQHTNTGNANMKISGLSGSNQKYQGNIQNIQNIIPSIMGASSNSKQISSSKERSSSSKVVIRKSTNSNYNENIPNLSKKLSDILPPKIEKHKSSNIDGSTSQHNQATLHNTNEKHANHLISSGNASRINPSLISPTTSGGVSVSKYSQGIYQGKDPKPTSSFSGMEGLGSSNTNFTASGAGAGTQVNGSLHSGLASLNNMLNDINNLIKSLRQDSSKENCNNFLRASSKENGAGNFLTISSQVNKSGNKVEWGDLLNKNYSHAPAYNNIKKPF